MSSSESSARESLKKLSLKDEEPLPERPEETLALSEISQESAKRELEAEEGVAAPAPVPFRTILVEFVKEIASRGTFKDLHLLSCPAILMNGISLLEYHLHWAEYPQLLADISTGKTLRDRFVAALRWYFGTLTGMYASRSKSGGFERKPFNPILGEQLHASWPDLGYGSTDLVCEQVSHHPPVTAFFLENKSAGVAVCGYTGAETRLSLTSASVEAKQTGFIRIKTQSEEFRFGFPVCNVRGILSGNTFIELTGQMVAASTCGSVEARIEFENKPWIGGEYDVINGTVFEGGKPVGKLSGRWSRSVKLHLKHHHQHVLFDVEATRRDAVPRVRSDTVDERMQSRSVWKETADALARSDYNTANRYKNAVEEHQRKLARSNSDWKPALFVRNTASATSPSMSSSSSCSSSSYDSDSDDSESEYEWRSAERHVLSAPAWTHPRMPFQ